jgi:conjugal transfer pilus assembly protein TraD
MPQRTYDDPFRDIYEWPAIAAWLTSAVAFALLAVVSALPSPVLMAGAVIGIGMALRLVPSVVRLHRFRQRLHGKPLAFLQIGALAAMMKEAVERKAVWLGYGFEWRQEHTQILDHVMRMDPDIIRKIDAKNAFASIIGKKWMHGFGRVEKSLWVSLEALAGHLLIVGTTGAGKTRMFDTLIAQAILRGEAVIVIDPKGDRDLCDAMRELCDLLGQSDRFVYFHPAHPSDSVRLDTMRNFNRTTEPASRIASLISASGDDPFKNFGQMEMNNLVQGMLLINAKPSLVMMRRYLEGGADGLLVKAAEAWFERKMPGTWEVVAKDYIKSVKGRTAADFARAYVQCYRDKFQQTAGFASSELEGLISSFEHDKTHYAKMIATLLPILNQLTTGELGQLLSPDPEDRTDGRQITDFNSIISDNKVAYVGLDTLSDPIVGASIGSLALADLTALAGATYNYSRTPFGAEDPSARAQKKAKPVNIYVDEAAEVMNDPLIQLLNKGRGAGYRVTLATQTLADFSARTGSRDKAIQILGNVNNIVAQRIQDTETQAHIADKLMKTYVQQLERGHSMAAGTKADLHYSGSVNESVKNTEVEIFPPALLGTLPNLEFFANVAGGTIYKGRIPILDKSRIRAIPVPNANEIKNAA